MEQQTIPRALALENRRMCGQEYVYHQKIGISDIFNIYFLAGNMILVLFKVQERIVFLRPFELTVYCMKVVVPVGNQLNLHYSFDVKLSISHSLKFGR